MGAPLGPTYTLDYLHGPFGHIHSRTESVLQEQTDSGLGLTASSVLPIISGEQLLKFR